MAELTQESPVSIDQHLLTGEQYKQSLRDGRRVLDCDGVDVPDVTSHPHLARTVETMAALQDLQFEPETRDRLTYVGDDGRRRAIGWQVPTTKADLYRKRDAIGLITERTLGMYGRPPDYGPGLSLGFLAVMDRLGAISPEFADNVTAFIQESADRNALSTDLILDVQSDRAVHRNDRTSTLRIVDETADTVTLRGAKVAGSMGTLTHYFTLSTIGAPDLDPDAALWCAVPVNSPGLTLVMREPMVAGQPRSEDHPVDAQGEEMDQLILFDDVVIPRRLVFSMRNKEVLRLHHDSVTQAHWHITTRLGFRAQLFAGTAQAIVDILGTASIPAVRNVVAQISMYAEALKAFSIASIEESIVLNGVRVPNPALVSTGRLYSIVNYPHIVYLLQDLCGQGLVSRWPSKVWEHPELKDRLHEYLRGPDDVSALDKNAFFNFVFDLTTGAQAGRVGLFENVNATPPAAVAEAVYRACDRSGAAKLIRSRAGMTSVE